MLRGMILSLCFLFSSTAFAQPATKDFRLDIGTYSAELTFLKKGIKAPYDAILFNTGKLAELKLHFESLEESYQIQTKHLTESCVAETESLKLEIFSSQEQIEALELEISSRDKVVALLEDQIKLERESALFEKRVIYTVSGLSVIAASVVTFLVFK